MFRPTHDCYAYDGFQRSCEGLCFLTQEIHSRRAAQQWKSVDAKRLNKVLVQSKQLQQADIVVLNEVDWGLKRTGYRNVVKDLATATRMNYAYGVEFVEVDPLTLGTETLEGHTLGHRA